MRSCSVGSITGNTNPSFGVVWRRIIETVKDSPLVKLIRQETREGADSWTPRRKCSFDLLVGGRSNHFLFIFPLLWIGDESHNIHQCLTCYWEVKNMGLGSDVHVLVFGSIIPKGFDSGVDGDETAVAVLMGIGWIRSRVALTKEKFSDARLDSICTNDCFITRLAKRNYNLKLGCLLTRIGFSCSSVKELKQHLLLATSVFDRI
jgi:hypothetical protein